jgi:hypothetical protein
LDAGALALASYLPRPVKVISRTNGPDSGRIE